MPPPPCAVGPSGKCLHAGEYCSSQGQTVEGSNGPITCRYNNGLRWEPA
jgi:hypothetical protein